LCTLIELFYEKGSIGSIRNLSYVDQLLNQIYQHDEYNRLIRPIGKNITKIEQLFDQIQNSKKTSQTVKQIFGVEKLFEQIFQQNKYNKLVRPTARNTTLTEVFTELKMLQIDLVIYLFVFTLIRPIFIHFISKNEKYQELIRYQLFLIMKSNSKKILNR